MINTLFKDLKVVEFAGVLAGPSVGMFLAELGAQGGEGGSQKWWGCDAALVCAG
ncbi:MAG: hypothetical protein R2784_17905 [Saprospiraceae bacterium]